MTIYSASFTGVAVTAQQDIFELAAPSSKAVIIHEVRLSQSSDVKDTEEEILPILLRRGVGSTTGSGGSTPTVIKLQTGDGTAGVVAKANNTTRMSTGTITTMVATTWNVRTEFLYLPTPECRPVLAPSERFTAELSGTPADSLTCHGTILFEEIG